MAQATVHFIDDESSLAEVLAPSVEDLGLQMRTYSNVVEFLAQYTPGEPGCIVTDIRLPGLSGLELVQRLRAAKDTAPIIVITGYADVAMAVGLMKAGVHDVIEKGCSFQLLLDAITRAVADGNKAYELETAAALWKDRLQRLNTRETEVLMAVTAGKTTQQVSDELKISISTVEVHRAQILEKMQLESLTDLVKAGVLAGVITPFPRVRKAS